MLTRVLPERLGCRMEFELITNEGRGGSWPFLQEQLLREDLCYVRAAISYVMTSGVRAVKETLEETIESGVSVSVIFGSDFMLSQSDALEMLLDIGVDLYVYDAARSYHPKLWILDLEDGKAVFQGSSNLSLSALRFNVEANVLLTGSDTELAEYDEFWSAIAQSSRPFSRRDLQQYRDAEATMAITLLDFVGDEQPNAVELLDAHVQRWQRYISEPHKLGHLEKWRGWYFLPEHGELDLSKLRELGRVIAEIRALPEYGRTGSASFKPDVAGVRNAARVIRRAGVIYAKEHTDEEIRVLFVRQQRNYLVKLGFLRQLSGDRYEVTDDGEALSEASSDVEFVDLLTSGMETVTWAFGPIAFYPFLRDLLDRLPDKRIYEDELSLIAIHSYHHTELEGIAALVTLMRELSAARLKKFVDRSYERLESLLGKHAGISSFGHYIQKVEDLMVALGGTRDIDYVSATDDTQAYLELA